MPEPIVYIDRSTIRAGRAEELKQAVRQVVDLIEAREPQLLSYAFHVDDAAGEMTVVAVHPDAESLVTHLDVGGKAFRGLAELIDLQGIDVYGSPSEPAMERLRDKAGALGAGARVRVHRRDAGFDRLSARSAGPR